MELRAGSHQEPRLLHTGYNREDGGCALAVSPENDSDRVACPVAADGFTIHMPSSLHYAGRNATAHGRNAWIIHFSRFGDAEVALKRLFRRVPLALR
jgi:hypothetical protein